jgi:pyruvate/2-oxoglutarate dehydrogenase complex dihydrolipoamide acyltransferase (E2) component
MNEVEVPLYHLSGPAESYVLSAWRLRVGDTVEAPQVIATIETSLFTLDFEAFESGILSEQCFAVGDIIPNGAIVARIACSTEDRNR